MTDSEADPSSPWMSLSPGAILFSAQRIAGLRYVLRALGHFDRLGIFFTLDGVLVRVLWYDVSVEEKMR